MVCYSRLEHIFLGVINFFFKQVIKKHKSLHIFHREKHFDLKLQKFYLISAQRYFIKWRIINTNDKSCTLLKVDEEKIFGHFFTNLISN